jgi:hypothetical protein
VAQQDLLKQSHDSYKVLGEVAQKQALAAVPVVVGEPWDLQWEYTSENMCVWVVKKWGITVELAVLRCVFWKIRGILFSDKPEWQCVKTLYPCSSHQNSWDLWMFIPIKVYL